MTEPTIDFIVDARTERPQYWRVVLAHRSDEATFTIGVDLYAYDGDQARTQAREAAQRSTGIENWYVERTEIRG